MLSLDVPDSVSARNDMTRRDFLHAGAFALLGLGMASPGWMPRAAQGAFPTGNDVNCILLFLHGGPSHLDTWDMKPDAPREIRGPFQPIKTNVPGIEICEIFPRMAQHADKFSIVRSVHHAGEVTHETARKAIPLVPPGALHSVCQTDRNHIPTHRVRLVQAFENSLCTLPGENHRHSMYRQPALCPTHEAFAVSREPDHIQDKYGRNSFGQSCLIARRLVERGVRFVTVNMFQSVFDEMTWDSHGHAPFPALDVYRTQCGPWFDNGYASLIEELSERGLYAKTIVLAMGEFGRTPRLNVAGGRDHWPHCWSVVMGGGGLKGGQIVGASDSIGAYPTERPTTPADIASTLYAAMSLDTPHARSSSGSQSVPGESCIVNPLRELL